MIDCVAVDEFEHSRVAERNEVLRQVAGAIALVRMRRVFPFRRPRDVTCVGKSRTQVVTLADGKPTHVIEVEVRRERNLDLRWLGRPHSASEPSRSRLRSIP